MGSKIDHVVVNVEIQRSPDDVPGSWSATDKLGVAVAVVYEFLTDRYHVYLENDVDDLRARLLRADRISGFNIWKFDFPVIFGLPGRERKTALLPKTNDILRRIWQSQDLDPESFGGAHKGWSLDAVCKGTFGTGKSGNGADAPKWYQAGELSRVISYCLDDVRLERDLTRYVDRFGYVVHDTKGVLRLREDGR
jgi:DEAD/DEAH box helicase domain-containing protein